MEPELEEPIVFGIPPNTLIKDVQFDNAGNILSLSFFEPVDKIKS